MSTRGNQTTTIVVIHQVTLSAISVIAAPMVAVLSGLLLSGCGSKEAAVPAREWVIQAPENELKVTVPGVVGHRKSESVRAPVEGLRLEWMASEGTLVEAGQVIARFDTELLELWLRSNQEDLAILERRMRAADLASGAKAYELRATLEDAEADNKALNLAYELSKEQDEAERAILARELELARETLAEATKKLDTVKTLLSLGGAAAAEVRQAMVAYERALAAVKIPEVKLAVFDSLDGSEERMLLDQDLVKLGLKLASETDYGSLRSRLAVAIADHEQDRRAMELEQQRLDDTASDIRHVVDDSVFRTDSGGVIGGGGGDEVPMVAGAELGAKAMTEVLPPEEAIIQVTIPELLREAVLSKGHDGYRVRARIPSIDDRWLDGRLKSVSVVKQNDQGVKPAYAGTVVLDELPANLTFGAGVECEIRIPVPDGAVVIPRWWASKGFRPLVRLAGGETRRVDAQIVGDWLVVSDGLKIGDRILPPDDDAKTSVVLYSAVLTPEREEIKVEHREPWKWVIEECIDDGTLVEAGQVVVRIRMSNGQKVRGDAAELEKLKADADLYLGRAAANGKLGTDYMDWQEARIAAEVARLKYVIARRKEDDTGVAQGQVGARLATLQRQQATEEFQRQSAPAYDDILSVNQRAEDELNVEITKMKEEQALLSAASASNYQKSVDLWTARQNWHQLSAVADTKKQAFKRAETTHRNRIAVAESKYQEAMLTVEQLRSDAAQGAITTPVSGRLFHNNEGWNSIDVGDRIYNRHMFNIPTGTKRQFIVNLPARLYGELAVGQDLGFYLPAEGAKRHTGRVIHIADFFEKRLTTSTITKSKYGRSVSSGEASTESTVRVTVEFEADDENSAPPGMTVVIELDKPAEAAL